MRFLAPEGWDHEAQGRCLDVMARVDYALGEVSVAWEPTPAELAILNAGGSVVMTAVGGLPPHRVTAEAATERLDG